MATSVPAPIGQADVGAGQSRCVVDAVADHRDGQAAGLQLGDSPVLVGGEHLGEDLVNAGPEAQVGGDGLGDGAGVSGDHDDLLDALLPQLGDGLARPGTDLVLPQPARCEVLRCGADAAVTEPPTSSVLYPRGV
jgi:hypothetical protein